MVHDKLDRIREATARALSRYADAVELAQKSGPPQAGELYRLAAADCLFWLIVKTSDNNDRQLLVAPADGHPQVGPGDFALPDDLAVGPCTLRTRFAMWVNSEALADALRVARLSQKNVADVERRMKRIDSSDASDEQEEVEYDLNYEEWLREVAAAREQLAERYNGSCLLPESPEVLALFRDDFEVVQATTFAAHEQLAAADVSEMVEAAALEPDTEVGVATVRIGRVSPGEFSLTIEADGVRAFYATAHGEAPPVTHFVDQHGSTVLAQWSSSPNGESHRTRQPIPWREGRAELSVAQQSIVIRNEKSS